MKAVIILPRSSSSNKGSNWLFKTLPFCCFGYRNEAWWDRAHSMFVNLQIVQILYICRLYLCIDFTRTNWVSKVDLGRIKCVTCFCVSQRGPKSVSSYTHAKLFWSQSFSTIFVSHHTMFSDEILAIFVQLQSKTGSKSAGCGKVNQTL